MSLTLLQAPALEPVSLDDAKLHLRVTEADEDSLISIYIAAARRTAEALCRRSFITQKWRLTLDAFPACVELERGPVQSIDAISYLDWAGAWQTVNTPAAPAYAIDLTSPLPRLMPGWGQSWPDVRPQIASVRIDYTAGYGLTAATVPEAIRHWMLLRIGTAYENREEVVSGALKPLPYVDRLLDEPSIVLA